MRADHEWVLALSGYGLPTLVVDGFMTLFGPVITPAPAGDAAGRLWDTAAAWVEFPHLYEIRRPKVEADWKHIETSFGPYLNAHDWQTIQTRSHEPPRRAGPGSVAPPARDS